MLAVTPSVLALMSATTSSSDIIFVKPAELVRVVVPSEASRLVAVRKFEVSVAAPIVMSPWVETTVIWFAWPNSSFVMVAVTPMPEPLIAASTSSRV